MTRYRIGVSRIGVSVIFEILLKNHSDPLHSAESKIENLKSKMDLLNDLIRLHQRPLRNRQADLLGGLEIDDKLELHRLTRKETRKGDRLLLCFC